ncbi:MAG: VPLPA-CTERM sorting domain-containing protein [Gammaproteobacteria bacterium]|nr:VPLPA-CTERM sorting domain-containing protein [Gammaproteobacteria bacterium]
MTIKKRELLASIVLGTLVTTPAVQAAYVQVDGSFGNPSASGYFFYDRIYNQDGDTSPAQNLPSNLLSSTDSVAYFGWGIDVVDSIITNQTIQSHFWFNGLNSVGGSTNPNVSTGDTFSLGSFTYTNEQTVFDGGVVDIDFQMDITIDGQNLGPVNYGIQIDNTRNSLPNSDDTATLTSMPTSTLVSLGGVDYLLTLNGFTRDFGSSYETWTSLPEGQQTTAEIYATLTAVPVPAAVWLFGSGLIGLFGLAKRKARS